MQLRFIRWNTTLLNNSDVKCRNPRFTVSFHQPSSSTNVGFNTFRRYMCHQTRSIPRFNCPSAENDWCGKPRAWRGRKSACLSLFLTVMHYFEIVLATLALNTRQTSRAPTSESVTKDITERSESSNMPSNPRNHQYLFRSRPWKSPGRISTLLPSLKCFTLQNQCRHRCHPLPRYIRQPFLAVAAVPAISSGKSRNYWKRVSDLFASAPRTTSWTCANSFVLIAWHFFPTSYDTVHDQALEAIKKVWMNVDGFTTVFRLLYYVRSRFSFVHAFASRNVDICKCEFRREESNSNVRRIINIKLQANSCSTN